MKVNDFIQKAVFFDRDGVLNHLIHRDDSFYSPQKLEDFHIFDEAKKVVKIVKDMGFLAIVVSNQPDISRGKLKQSELDKMTAKLFEKLSIDDVFYCTHDDDNDIGCRKPAPGLFITAKEKYNLDFNISFMVGDTWKDVEAAKNAGIPMILINKDYNQDLENVIRVNSLPEVVSLIKNGF
ncbi:MAG: HAD-IIIA family hydrolase [Candidatus Marinimicrobia bacterium]|nr:HAD-IIIA family hydrolase [Candidatus Neomarinimicrobiota bacterium]